MVCIRYLGEWAHPEKVQELQSCPTCAKPALSSQPEGYGPRMAIAALIVSILALIVSGAAVVYAKQQASAATETATLEKRRRVDERRPKFDGVIERVPNSGWDRLEVRLVEGERLPRIGVSIVEGEGVQFAGNQEGASGPEPRDAAISTRPLMVGDAATWRVLLADDCSSRIRLMISCRGLDGAKWHVSLWVDTPKRPMIAWV